MISYAQSDSPVVKQGAAGQESPLWDPAANARYCLVSHRSTDPTIIIMNAFSVGPTFVSRPRVEVVSGTLPKSDRAVRARRTEGQPPVATVAV